MTDFPDVAARIAGSIRLGIDVEKDLGRAEHQARNADRRADRLARKLARRRGVDEVTPATVEDLEATLERWSQNNELDAWAFLTTRGIEVQDPGTGRVLATVPVEAWEDFTREADRAA